MLKSNNTHTHTHTDTRILGGTFPHPNPEVILKIVCSKWGWLEGRKRGWGNWMTGIKEAT